MRKNSALFLAIVVVTVATLLLAVAGCNDQKPADAQKELFPSGVATSKLPGSAQATTEAAPAKDTTTNTPAPVKAGKYSPPTAAEIAAAKAAGTRKAIIKTDKGEMVAELYGKDAPLTVANFVKLAKAKFYDGLTFHRVEQRFVIQGGDPAGNGSGGPGYNIKLEIAKNLKHIEGALAMARSDAPDSAGSQFYITLAATPDLDGKYAVFGKVVKNLDVSKQIAIGDKIISITIQ